MQLLIDEIVIPRDIAEGYTGDLPFNSLKGCKKLNVIFGPNNSGKSRLLRQLFLHAKSLLVAPYSESGEDLQRAIHSALACICDCKSESWVSRGVSLDDLERVLKRPSLSFAKVATGFPDPDRHADVAELQTEKEKISEIINNYSGNFKNSPKSVVRSVTQVSDAIDLVASKGQTTSINKLYIPTLRGLRALEQGENANLTYYKRTWDDYFTVGGEDVRNENAQNEIFTGLGLYEDIAKKLLGAVSDRKSISDFEEFLGENFFDSQPVTLIPRHKSDTLEIKIGKEAQRPITKVGDGVQQLIILTWPIFRKRDTPLFLFIEEPDLFLHPGFQRLFINTILSDRNPNLFVFVTTHSHQFLDLTLESEKIAVFRCEKEPSSTAEDEHDSKFTVKNAGEASKEILKHVGVNPSSLMLANCTIWVEGVTDRLYLGKYLQLYFEKEKKSYHENLHYMFVEYSGSNITHWAFLDEDETDKPDPERLCADMILIADDDGATGEKEKRHGQLSETLGKRYIRLETREIENMLMPSVIKGIIKSYEEDDVELEEFNYENYKKIPLGNFIDETVLVDLENSKRYKDSLRSCRDPENATGYADSSGTVKAKGDFCKKALTFLNDYSDLSEDAKKVTERLAEFIIAQNPR